LTPEADEKIKQDEEYRIKALEIKYDQDINKFKQKMQID
jgi:hypothetical protein